MNSYIYMLFLDVEGKVPEHRITGQYRNKSNRIWDPHPQYLIDAFNLHLHLILYQDNDFIPKHMKVILLKKKKNNNNYDIKRPNKSLILLCTSFSLAHSADHTRMEK